MKALHDELAASLALGVTTQCTCWRVERRDGVVLGFTDHDAPLEFDSVIYEPDAGFTATALRSTSEFSVDEAEVAGALDSARLKEVDVAAGCYDDAAVEIWRVDWRNPDARICLKSARIGRITRADGAFKAELRGLSAAFEKPTGRLIHRMCDARLGDQRCGVDLDQAAFCADGVVARIVSTAVIEAEGLSSYASGWFVHGALNWTAGGNAGRNATVRGHALRDGVAVLELATSPFARITVGDALSIRAGCDKRAETCRDKFANILNFRGFPDLPGPDAVYRHASRAP